MTTLCTLRTATPADAAAIRAIYAPYVQETSISFETEVPSVMEMQQRLHSTLEQYPWIVGIDAGAIVGYAYAGKFHQHTAYQWSVETSVYIDRMHHGRGFGRRLYTTLIELLRAQGLIRAYAGITMPNPASVALHTAVGFQHIGTFAEVGFKQGRWHDVSAWVLAVSPLAHHVSPPTPFTQIPAATVHAILESR